MRTTTDPKPTPAEIADHVVEAILGGRIGPGQRLGEQELADVFGVSRTLVREAMSRLAARGMVEVQARRGWYVTQPSAAAAAEAFQARRAIETGLLIDRTEALPAAHAERLRAHHRAERAAIDAGDSGRRSYLLGHFHVCLADCLAGPLMADILRDLTARTALAAMLHQSAGDAERSCDEHLQIVQALEAGDGARAATLMRAHIAGVARDLAARAEPDDPREHLRRALRPRPGNGLFSGLMDSPDPTPRPARHKEP